MDIPSETIIKFSKWKLAWFAATIFVIVGGIISLFQGVSVISSVLTVFAIALGLTSAYAEYWDILNINKPQLIIGIKGIQTNYGELYEWNKISNEKIQGLGSFKQSWFLWFETPGRNCKLHLDGLDKTPAEIMKIVEEYKMRYLNVAVIGNP